MDRYSELNEQIDKMRLHIEVLESHIKSIERYNDIVQYNNNSYTTNQWYPLENEDDYWIDGEVDQCFTLVTDGVSLYNKSNCPYGWSTMIKAGYWRFMIVKIK